MSAEVSVRGSIEVRTYGRSKQVIRLVSCPFCGYAFGHNEHRWKHFFDDHGPEDAGLSPLNEPTPELVTDGGTSFTFHDADSCDECDRENAGVETEDGRALCGECALSEGV